MPAPNKVEDHGRAGVTGTVLPRLELRGVRVLRRSDLAREHIGPATVVVWPHGDRGRPEDVCWVGLGRMARPGQGPSALPPLPAVECEGVELARLERTGDLSAVLRKEGLARALSYDVCLHGPDGEVARLVWSIKLVAPSLRRACEGRGHTRLAPCE